MQTLDIPEMHEIFRYVKTALSTDHTYAPICGVVRYVGPGFLVIAHSSTYHELKYLKPYLDTAINITEAPEPMRFKRGNHRWNKAIYVRNDTGVVLLYLGVLLFNVICERYDVVTQPKRKPVIRNYMSTTNKEKIIDGLIAIGFAKESERPYLMQYKDVTLSGILSKLKQDGGDSKVKKDRHRPGYYKDYAARTGKKDHHRKGYYHEYNKEHPERLERIGINYDSEDEYCHPFSSEGLGQD